MRNVEMDTNLNRDKAMGHNFIAKQGWKAIHFSTFGGKKAKYKMFITRCDDLI